VSQDVNRMNRT